MLHRFSVLTAVLTFPLIFAGATVTTRDAALSVPDWPLSYGTLFPRMVGNIRYEHWHRLIAALVGLCTLVVAIWIQRAERRRWVRTLGWTALAAVVAQAALGGLTVLALRPRAVSAVHASLAQAFFALMASIALVTSPTWTQKAGGRAGSSSLQFLAIATVVLTYLQIVLGAAVRHLEAALSIPDFPLAFGALWPPVEKLADVEVLVHFAHRLLGGVVLLVATAAAARALRSGLEELRAPAVLLLVLLPVQILLGAATVWSGREYLPSTLHVAFGALVLLSAVALALRSGRLTLKREEVEDFSRLMTTRATLPSSSLRALRGERVHQ